MKHRKFVKQLMAEGLERNAAEEMAVYAQRHRIPYFKALGDFLTLLACWEYNLKQDRMELAVCPERNAWLEVLAGE